MPVETSSVDRAKLIIVDDELEQMKALCATLECEGFIARGFASAHEALACLRREGFDVIITDLMMPEMDGISLVRAAREIDRDLVGIVMTGHGTIPTAVEAMKVGAVDYILKPFNLSNILAVLARALHLHRVQVENIQLREAAVIYEQRLAIARGMDVETVLKATVEAVYQQSEEGEVAILLPTMDGCALEVVAARGSNESTLGKTRVPLDPGLQWWSRRVGDEFDAGGFQGGDLDLLEQHPLSGFRGIALPVRAHGELSAVLTFCSGIPHKRISQGNVKTLSVLAGTAASALETVTLLQRLMRAEERYRRLAENALDIVYRYEQLPQPHFSYLNPAVITITGYAPEEFYKDAALGTAIIVPEDRLTAAALLRGELPSASTATLRFQRKDGVVIWTEQRIAVIRSSGGRVIAVEGIARDVTERKRAEEIVIRLNEELERRVRERTRELELTTRDLEAFSGSVAHDLRAPLSIVEGFCDLFLLEYGSQVPAGGTRLLDEALTGLRRMRRLIEDLLAFAQLGREPLRADRVRMAEVVDRALALARQHAGARDVQVVIHELADCEGDASLLQQVVANLLSNAFKFTASKADARIEIRSEAREEAILYFVRDNGVGFDPRTASKLFTAFERLPSASGFAGTGVGLSIVHRIIERHGGRVWAEAAPDAGATFYFTVPKSAEQRSAQAGSVHR